jgi:prepilin-type N-terminal cleavage/methylation domain-containing protein
MSPTLNPIVHRTSQPLGFSLVEVLITLSLLSGSYLIIFSCQQWLSSSILGQERKLQELLHANNQHELNIALSMKHEDE